MKLTLSNVKAIKRDTESQLTKRVCNYVISRWGDYDDKKHIFTDVLHYGCQSGVVGELIYYSDTVRFYKQYRQENQCAAVRTYGRNGTLCSFRTVRRQVGQRRSPRAGRLQSKPVGVVRL